MQHCYIHEPTRSIADVSHVTGDLWEINRIKVGGEFNYGRGHGRELLRRITTDADATGATLRLTINPYGPLDYDALACWYERYGFRRDESGWYIRVPVTT